MWLAHQFQGQTVKGQGYRRAWGIPYPLSPIVWDMPINIQVSLPRLQNLNFIYLLRTFTLSVNCITGIILTFIVPLCFYICLNVCTTLNVLVIVLNPAPCCYTSIKSMCVLAEPGDHIVCYLNWGRGYAINAVCLLFTHPVCEQDYCKSNQLISLKLGVMIRPTSWKNWSTVGGDLVPDTESTSLIHVPHYCGIGDFRRFISIFMTLGKMTDADFVMSPQHFGSDPADIRISQTSGTESGSLSVKVKCLCAFWQWRDRQTDRQAQRIKPLLLLWAAA